VTTFTRDLALLLKAGARCWKCWEPSARGRNSCAGN
jgi:hypothetical protein